MCKEVGRQSFNTWDHYRSVDRINGSWLKDHWGG